MIKIKRFILQSNANMEIMISIIRNMGMEIIEYGKTGIYGTDAPRRMVVFKSDKSVKKVKEKLYQEFPRIHYQTCVIEDKKNYF